MIYTLLVMATIGVATGLRFRIPLIASSAVLLSVGTSGGAVYFAWSLSDTMIIILGVLAVHQSSFLIGLFLATYILPPRVAETG